MTAIVTVLRKLGNENLISVLLTSCFYLLLFQKESPWDVELHLAAARGDAKRLRILLDSGRVHVDCKDKVSIIRYPPVKSKIEPRYRECDPLRRSKTSR